MKDLPNLDFIRAVAVLSVVIDHLLLSYKIMWIGPWEVRWIGGAGVCIFFVHTALVLMWSLERKPHTLDFYIRRIFRIYPLALLAFAATVAFHAPVNGPPNHLFVYLPPHGLSDIVSAATLTPNLFPHSYLPEGVMWSLPFEVQMYLALPVVFFFVRRNFQLWPLLVFWSFIVLVTRNLFPSDEPNFFLCIPYFLPGIMAYIAFGRRKPSLPSWILPIALLCMLAAFVLRPSWHTADLLCLAVGLGLPSFHQITAPWLVRASHQVAKYSYGVYLAHPFALAVGVYLMPHRALALQLTVTLTLVVVLPVAAYHLLEHPMIRLGSRLANRAEKRFEQHQLEQFRIPVGEIR